MGSRSSLSGRMSVSTFLRYTCAIAAVLSAVLLGSALTPLVGDRVAYVLVLPAIAFSAWYCGIGPSAVATFLALVGAMYEPVTRVHSLRVPSRGDTVLILAFLFSSIIVVAMAETRRRQNERLQKAQGELEACVRERTADLDNANQSLRGLSARLLQLQDEERRRIARELHDSVGQMLAALNMNLSTVRGDVERLINTANALSDSENLVRQMSTEVRTISHLLHPPLLDEAGLSSALQWYVDGFAGRSNIKVDLHLPERFERLPREAETAIFRVVQECLTNIHRHSGSAVAKIRLRRRINLVTVEIEDKGKGIPPAKLQEMNASGMPGVGIRGMRERIRQLGGTLEINSTDSGTVVVVTLPIAQGSLPSDTVEVSDHSPAAA